MSGEVQLRPPETSIARPTEAELRELIQRLGLELTETAPMQYSVTEGGGRHGRHAQLVLEGSADGIELIRLVPTPGEAGVAGWLRSGLARELGWGLYDPKKGRWLAPAGTSPRARRRHSASAIRSGIMVACAAVVLGAVVIWHAGDRRHDAWLGVIGLAVAVYFALRVWGFVDRLGSRGPRP